MNQEPLTLYKLIVLYLLNKVSFPLTMAQVSDLILEKEYTSYLTLQQVINELAQAGLLTAKTLVNRTHLQITEEGRNTLSYFENRISDAIKTDIGRHLYAVGGNEKATKLSGINTKKVYFFAYANMGFLAALAGVLTIARMASAQPTYGDGYEMDAIGACFIGGASAYGGVGTVPGVIVGAVLMGVINLGMSVMGIDQNFQKVVKGGVLLAAVVFDVLSKREDS